MSSSFRCVQTPQSAWAAKRRADMIAQDRMPTGIAHCPEAEETLIAQNAAALRISCEESTEEELTEEAEPKSVHRA